MREKRPDRVTCDVCGAEIDGDWTSCYVPVVQDVRPTENGFEKMEPDYYAKPLDLCRECLDRATAVRVIPGFFTADRFEWREGS